jgi:general secretion pathway protein C
LFNTWTPRLIEPARWLIIIGIAATLAQTVLFVISGPQSSQTSSTPVRATVQQQRSQTTSINAILSRNLFGAADASSATAIATPTVETRLPLELRGVFVADVAEDSAAIVAQKGKTGELYAIGAVVPGNAELMEVHPDHIVLRRAGNLETLTFPEVTAALVAGSVSGPGPESYDGMSDTTDSRYFDQDNSESIEAEGGSSASRTPGRGAASTPREFVDRYRDQLEEDPQGALSDLGIAPVTVDGAEGYRLGNLAQSPYLSQTGLQPGDVVLSVNGAPVGNIKQDRQQIDNILNQGSARLEVQRGTRRFFVTASLK